MTRPVHTDMHGYVSALWTALTTSCNGQTLASTTVCELFQQPFHP